MDKRFRNQLLAENQKREEEIKNVNLEIEEREVSENGPFVLIRNKKNKWIITTCGALVNGKEFEMDIFLVSCGMTKYADGEATATTKTLYSCK